MNEAHSTIVVSAPSQPSANVLDAFGQAAQALHLVEWPEAQATQLPAALGRGRECMAARNAGRAAKGELSPRPFRNVHHLSWCRSGHCAAFGSRVNTMFNIEGVKP